MRRKSLVGLLVIVLLISNFILPRKCFAEGEDKVLHAGLSLVISEVAYNFYKKKTDLTDNQAKIAAVITTLAVGVVKESVDDDFSDGDMIADVGGAVLGAVLAFEF